MEQRNLKPEYKEYGFIRTELEDLIGFSLGIDNDFLPDYLKPYKTRIGIQLKEAANILAGCKPKSIENHDPLASLIGGYMSSLWDAYDNDILTGSNIIMVDGYNEDYRADITLVKDEITKWAKLHNLDWPFKLPVTEINNENNINDLLMTIERLELENNSLELIVSELKSSQPSLLGVYRDDDPLLIAIKLRNEEWADYTEDSRPPVQEALVKQVISGYEKGMTEAQARAIEKVACPIKRR